MLWAVWVSSVSDSSLLQLLLLKVYRPLQCLVNVNNRILICCTCQFQSGSIFFILASSLCKSLQCLCSAVTQGAKDGHLFRLTCSVVLWVGRETANKCHWCVWGVLTVYGPHLWHVLSRSTLLRLQGALQGHCPK